MISIKNNSKIYILSPFHNTGGPKSLHQLANVLCIKGYETYMVYVKNNKILKNNNILYDFCNAKIANSIEDNEDNIVIAPETCTTFFFKYNNIKKVIWWLSLDYYLAINLCEATHSLIKRRGYNLFVFPLAMICLIIKHPNLLIHKKKLTKKDFINIYHLYNCNYVKDYLINSGAKNDNISYLCGPLERRFYKIEFDEIRPYKKDVVVYNPAKMNKNFFAKIMNEINANNMKVSFMAIENMSRDEVFNTLKSAKVYLDFGNFPGPERMPREAACLYCNIITSNMGSAKNDVDVAIPKKNKFNIKTKYSEKKVVELIEKFITNYDEYVFENDEYRNKIWNQIDKFEDNIGNLFVTK